jgi:hypothetical protein
MLAAMARDLPAMATALALLVLAACDPPAPADELPPDAAALLADVRAADYRGWARPGEWPARALGRAPHGAASDVFLDPTIAAALQRGDPIAAWPEGSTLVCDGFHDEAGESLAAIQIMRKRDGAWTWAQYDADGTPRVYGLSLACSHCHAAGADFVRTLELPE